jgi:hypothetical protein
MRMALLALAACGMHELHALLAPQDGVQHTGSGLQSMRRE